MVSYTYLHISREEHIHTYITEDERMHATYLYIRVAWVLCYPHGELQLHLPPTSLWCSATLHILRVYVSMRAYHILILRV